MVNFDDVTEDNIKKHNPNWSQVPDYPNKIVNNMKLWLWKNKFIIYSNKSETDIEKKLFIR